MARAKKEVAPELTDAEVLAAELAEMGAVVVKKGPQKGSTNSAGIERMTEVYNAVVAANDKGKRCILTPTGSTASFPNSLVTPVELSKSQLKKWIRAAINDPEYLPGYTVLPLKDSNGNEAFWVR